MENFNFGKNTKLVIWMVVFLMFSWVVFAYIQAEINTNFYLKDISNWQELCKVKENDDFKFARLLTYEKSKNNAKMYCIYEDPNKNLELNLNFRNDIWTPYFTKKLNREGNVYWPIYI